MAKSYTHRNGWTGTHDSLSSRNRSFPGSRSAARRRRTSAFATLIAPQDTVVRFAISVPAKKPSCSYPGRGWL